MKTANKRRRSGDAVLDVKVQTEARSRNRLRFAGAVVAVLVVASLTGYGLYRALRFGADRLVFANPQFTLKQITVETDGVLGEDRVIQFAGVQRGQNLFALDLEIPTRNLQRIPLVRRVEVRRVWPDRLHIRVNERVPVARLQVGGRGGDDALWWVDREGVVMKPLKLADGSMLRPQVPRTLPLLTGVKWMEMRVGQPVQSEQLYSALELLDRLAQSAAGALVEAEQIDASRAQQLVMKTRQGTTVRFAVEEFPRQLRRVSLILAWARQRQKTVQQVDLTVHRGVPVSFGN